MVTTFLCRERGVSGEAVDALSHPIPCAMRRFHLVFLGFILAIKLES